ncbi:hypothetical protein Q4519_14335 [Motilimonas sp. 1_MG-2023]|uniref:hypothetical protein n=1 Tax=Motilimonas sp. 1_MG-2023 TaxID=3062672 RepID=UPI0026E31D1F|nr:hypothetical protein [Motilimonas sp. 1_MG-2023]MDO6526863.1 hypothetical protein [Motilimonas sp. 1_MG-2023]
MDISIPDIISSHPYAATLGLSVAIIGLLVKTITGLISFYEDIYLKRYFKRLKSFDLTNIQSEQLNSYVESIKEAEIFFLASGIKTSKQNMAMLMKIYEFGVISHHELKRVEPYLRTDGEKVRIAVTSMDKFGFIYSLVVSIGMALLGSLSLAYLSISNGIEGAIVGIGLFGFTILTTLGLSKDFLSFRILQRTVIRLKKINMITNPDEKLI